MALLARVSGQGASVNVKTLGAEDLILFEGAVFPDNRGYFMELYKESQYSSYLPNLTFVQDNLSWSDRGVIRGMHLQIPPHEQGKLIRCLSGEIYDVVVDLRKNSKTFKKWFGVELSAKKNQALYVPYGFAHGFQALEDSLVVYKCTTEYAAKFERGIRYDSPELNIKWPIAEQRKVSDKDKILATLSEFNFDEI